jgi:hypothetical protein
VQVAVVIMCVVGVKTRAQEADLHSGPIGADRGYVAGEFAVSHAHCWDKCSLQRRLIETDG